MIFGIDVGGGGFGFEAREVDAVTEGFDGDVEFVRFWDKVVDGYGGWHGGVLGFFEEVGEVSADGGVDGLFDHAGKFDLASEVVGVGVAGGDERDVVFFGVAKDG